MTGDRPRLSTKRILLRLLLRLVLLFDGLGFGLLGLDRLFSRLRLCNREIGLHLGNRRRLRGVRIVALDRGLGRLDAGLRDLVVLVGGLERVDAGERGLLVTGLAERAGGAELGGERQVVLRVGGREIVERLLRLRVLAERLQALGLADDRDVRETVRRVPDERLGLRERFLELAVVLILLRKTELECTLGRRAGELRARILDLLDRVGVDERIAGRDLDRRPVILPSVPTADRDRRDQEVDDRLLAVLLPPFDQGEQLGIRLEVHSLFPFSS